MYPSFDKKSINLRRLRQLAGEFFLCLVVAFIFNVAIINGLFFDCNRVSRDCFLIDQLWGQP